MGNLARQHFFQEIATTLATTTSIVVGLFLFSSSPHPPPSFGTSCIFDFALPRAIARGGVVEWLGTWGDCCAVMGSD